MSTSKLSNSLRSVRAIVHATTPVSLRGILGLGRVLDQRSRSRWLGNDDFDKHHKLVAPRDITLSRTFSSKYGRAADPKGPYTKQFSEAGGVYFRLSTSRGDPSHNPLKPIQMLFSPGLLSQYDTWTLNSTENNGFVFGPHGHCLMSMITGKRGNTYFTHIEEDELEDIDPSVAELLIPEDVNLFNLEKVIVPISVVREVDALGVLDQYKNLIILQS